MELTLSKALKLKNRLVKKLNKVDADLARVNVELKENPHEVDATGLMKLRHRVVEDLVALKMSINEGNRDIQEAIYQMAECRGEIAMLNRLDTRHGVVMNNSHFGAASEKMECVAQIRKADVDTAVESIEGILDGLQDRVDEHNATTKITVHLQTVE